MNMVCVGYEELTINGDTILNKNLTAASTQSRMPWTMAGSAASCIINREKTHTTQQSP